MPANARRPAPPARAALRAAALAALLAAALAPGAAAVGELPTLGTYRARPAPVLACGGLVGDCRILLLEGTLDFAFSGLPAFPPVPPLLSIERSDLTLRSLFGDAVAFPAAGDLPLSALFGDEAGNPWVLESAAGAAQTVRLEVWPADSHTFFLRGTYDEGCCDRFRYEIGGVLFDFVGTGDGEALHLFDGGFRVSVEWQDHDGGAGVGTPLAFDDRSGHFWFFRPDNPELLVKVIDACELFDRWWFFAAGLTNVEVEIEVFGPGLFQPKVYTRPAGDAFEPILDTDAFPCSEPVI
jgi:hypothetical protein